MPWKAPVARLETRSDVADARLKKLESKMDTMVWIIAGASGLSGILGQLLTAFMR